MKIALIIGSLFLSLPSTGRSETLDTAVADDWFVALGSSGDLWYHPNDCSYSDWRYLMNFPGAYLVDSQGISVVVGPAEMQIGYFRLDIDPHFDFQRTIPIPPDIGPLSDIDLCDTTNPYKAILTSSDGALWVASFDPGPGPVFWTGPCAALPDEPISVNEESWGRVKERFR